MSPSVLGEGYEDSSSSSSDENEAVSDLGAQEVSSVDASSPSFGEPCKEQPPGPITHVEARETAKQSEPVGAAVAAELSFEEQIREQSPFVDQGTGEWSLPNAWRQVKCSANHITCIDTPLRGNRLITGDFSGNVKIYDFHSMDLEGERYMEIKLPNTRPIEALRFSATGAEILISDGERVAHIFSATQLTSIIDTYKGDIYVRDAANTTGHTHQIYDALWHPDNLHLFATASLDGTVRIWDATSTPQGLDHALVNLLVLKTVNARGSSISQDCPVHSIAFISDNEIVGGCYDGSLHLWEIKISSVKSRKPSKTLRGFVDEPIARVGASYGKGLIHVRTRHWLMLFDRRQFTAPKRKIPVPSPSSKLCCLAYMEYGRIVMTSSYEQESGRALVCLYLADTLETITVLPLLPESGKITALSYNESLRQIFVGTDKGLLLCFFHPHVSVEGILAVPTEKRTKQKAAHTLEGAAADETQMTFSWYELPPNIKQMKDGTLKEVKPRRFQLRAERNPAMVPSGADEPILKKTMAETVMKKFLKAESEHRGGDEADWVEEVRKGRGLGSKLYGDISIVEKAYKRTQPDSILDTGEDQDAGEALLMGERKCPQCGLKMCTCGYMEMIRGRLEAGKVLNKHRRIT